MIDCTNKELLPFDALLKSLFGVDASGNVYLRTVAYEVADCNAEGDAVNCDNLAAETVENIIRRAIVLDDCDKPAIRLGTVA